MWKCPKCQREFQKNKQSHSCVIYPLENHFEKKSEKSKEIFETLIEKIEKQIGKIKIESVLCCIHLVGDYTFCGVCIQKDKIKMDFHLDNLIKDKRFLKVINVSKNRYFYYLEIQDKDEIDEELLEWLDASYHRKSNKDSTVEKCCTS